MKRLRVGAVSYLNTKPLIPFLTVLAPEIDLLLAVPSQLADDLAAERLDVALIPSIEFFRAKNYTILPDVSISSFGPVMSVKVCSWVPFADIKLLALDVGSRTSIALTNILLFHLFGVEPRTQPLAMNEDPLQCRHRGVDAVLVIGDRAMRVRDGAFPYTLDLGYEWSRWTGLPFVFAFWAVRPGVVIPPPIQQAFVRAKELGRPEIPGIAKREAMRLRLDETQCRYYLEHVIRHDFGPEELAGLTRFQALAVERGLAPQGVACVFHGAEHLAESR